MTMTKKPVMYFDGIAHVELYCSHEHADAQIDQVNLAISAEGDDIIKWEEGDLQLFTEQLTFDFFCLQEMKCNFCDEFITPLGKS